MSWYCIKTQARHEAQAQFGIKRLGYAVFFPQVLQIISRERQPWRSGQRLVPMFGTYIFAQFDLGELKWPHILRQPGVIRVMSMPMSDGTMPRPIALDDGLIEALQTASREATQPPPVAIPPIAVGSTVRITEGPLASLEGIVQWSNAQRVALLLGWMGAERRVEVTRGLVEVVDGAAEVIQS